MVVSIPLATVVASSLVVSVALFWMNVRGGGSLGAAGATALACVAIILIQSIVVGALPSRLGWQALGVYLLAPSAMLLLVSRIGVLQARPWMLLLVGPFVFLLAATATMIVSNLLLARRH